MNARVECQRHANDPVRAWQLTLYKANKRKNNEDDHDCPDDVDNIVHENHLSISEQDDDEQGRLIQTTP